MQNSACQTVPGAAPLDPCIARCVAAALLSQLSNRAGGPGQLPAALSCRLEHGQLACGGLKQRLKARPKQLEPSARTPSSLV